MFLHGVYRRLNNLTHNLCTSCHAFLPPSLKVLQKSNKSSTVFGIIIFTQVFCGINSQPFFQALFHNRQTVVKTQS